MKIVARLFVLFTVVTVIELFLLLELAHYTNWWVTIAMIILPGIVGAWLARREGTRALGEISKALSLQREPAGAILDGVLVLLAAAFLITPGVLTDLAGVALLIPPVRRIVNNYTRVRIRRAIDARMSDGRFSVVNVGSAAFGGFDAGESYDVIDAEDIPKRR